MTGKCCNPSQAALLFCISWDASPDVPSLSAILCYACSWDDDEPSTLHGEGFLVTAGCASIRLMCLVQGTAEAVTNVL